MSIFTIYLWAMIVLAVIVFITLYFVNAGYGILSNGKWGKPISNKKAWLFMECPVFIAMLALWFFSERRCEITPLVFLLLFETHYIQRAFIFPFLIKGKSKMPLGIMFMGITFNLLNATMQGYWIFYLSPAELYTPQWLCTPQFIIGTTLFILGMAINIQSDHIIRHLRKGKNDTKHYLPKGGLFNYVTSANYFGELVEWGGFAVLTWSMPGLVFFIWTFANLVPRANATYKKYQQEFGDEMKERRLKRVIPFIY